MFPKQNTYRSEAWRRAVASLPCACCMKDGPSQAAHINQGKGMGLKTHDCWTVPLCPECHSEIDQGRKWDRQTKRELMDAWFLLTVAALAQQGLVKA
jgi:hypothetical protein